MGTESATDTVPGADPVFRKSFCRICLAYCGIVAQVEGDQVVAIRGNPDDPVSAGYVCPKGRSLGTLHHEHRLNGALLGRGADRRAVSISAGLDDAAQALARVVEQHGPEAVAVFSGTGASTTRSAPGPSASSRPRSGSPRATAPRPSTPSRRPSSAT